MPWRANSCFPWYSRRSISAARTLLDGHNRGAPTHTVAQPRADGIMPAMALPKTVTFVTFDVYGTLIDWETGIWDAFEAEADRDGFTIERDEVIPLFHEIPQQIEAGSYELYAEVLRRTAVEISKRLGWPLEPSRSGFLPDSVQRWPPFKETRPALRSSPRSTSSG